MGAFTSICAGTRQVKVSPDETEFGGRIFVPPIKHLKADNPWLPLLTPSQLVEIHTAFQKFDRDGDGHIEPKEISTIMRCVGTPISDDKARELIDSVDQDKNGKVEFDEFLGLMARKMLGPDGSNNEIEQAFGLFEAANQPGVIDLGKARDFLMTQGSNRLQKQELDEMFASLQPDANGCVPLEAFRALECWKAPLPSTVDASRQPG